MSEEGELAAAAAATTTTTTVSDPTELLPVKTKEVEEDDEDKSMKEGSHTASGVTIKEEDEEYEVEEEEDEDEEPEEESGVKHHRKHHRKHSEDEGGECERSRKESTKGIKVGDRMMCLWKKTGEKRAVEIVKIRNSKTLNEKEYYIHWVKFDKRLDDWVSETELYDMKTEDKKRRKADEQSSITTRSVSRKLVASGLEEEEPEKMSAVEREYEERTKVKNIHSVVFGRYEIRVWYYSPYPSEFVPCETLHICEFCLKYMKERGTLAYHRSRCACKHPPGCEIYRDGERSFWEIDGARAKLYCQNLCLLGKLFLEHKTLYYDVESFLFYVLTERDAKGCHVVGYFSKEKYSKENNLACIMTLPPHQRKGYGQYIIDFSYEISKLEDRIGSPERPLSDLGHNSYLSYWTRVALEAIHAHSAHKGSRAPLSLQDLVKLTAIKQEDIIEALHPYGLICLHKGLHVLANCPIQKLEELLKSLKQPKLKIKPELIHWVPPLTKVST